MKKPPIPVRILLQLVSFLLCITLGIGVLATAALLDLRMLTSEGGMQSIIDLVLSEYLSLSAHESTPQPQPQQRPSGYVVSLSSTDAVPDGDPSGDFALSDDLELPIDALTDSNALIDFVYDTISENAGDEVDISLDQVQEFVERSTVMEYTSEKINDYIQDALHGTDTALITTDEIMALLDENSALLQEIFDFEVTDEMRQAIRENVAHAVEEQDLNGTIREELDKVLDTSVPGVDVSVSALMQAVGKLTQMQTVLTMGFFCLILMLLLLAANYYAPGKGLGWSAGAFLFIGIILTAPLLVLRFGSSSLQLGGAAFASALQLATDMTGMLMPIHCGVLAAGFVMLVGSIVWRALCRRKAN